MSAQFGFIRTDHGRNEYLKILLMNLGKGCQALLSIDDETWRAAGEVNLDSTPSINIDRPNLDAVDKRNHDRIRKDGFRLLQIVPDFPDVTSDLRALKTTQRTRFVTGNTLDGGELLKFRCKGCKR